MLYCESLDTWAIVHGIGFYQISHFFFIDQSQCFMGISAFIVVKSHFFLFQSAISWCLKSQATDGDRAILVALDPWDLVAFGASMLPWQRHGPSETRGPLICIHIYLYVMGMCMYNLVYIYIYILYTIHLYNNSIHTCYIAFLVVCIYVYVYISISSSIFWAQNPTIGHS